MTLVIGIGNEYRGDDGVGRVLARRLVSRRFLLAVLLIGDPFDNKCQHTPRLRLR